MAEGLRLSGRVSGAALWVACRSGSVLVAELRLMADRLRLSGVR